MYVEDDTSLSSTKRGLTLRAFALTEVRLAFAGGSHSCKWTLDQCCPMDTALQPAQQLDADG